MSSFPTMTEAAIKPMTTRTSAISTRLNPVMFFVFLRIIFPCLYYSIMQKGFLVFSEKVWIYRDLSSDAAKEARVL